MKTPRIFIVVTLAVLFLFGGGAVHDVRAQAQISVDENGHAVFNPGGIPVTGVLSPDPGPGGQASALTYNLLGPPGLVAGDVLLSNGLGLSDVIRFNPAGTGGNPAYQASLVFYSLDGGTALADTGSPSAFYANTFSLMESLSGPTLYTPTSSEPGFVTGFTTTYSITSTEAAAPAVPEPATWLAAAMLAAVLAFTNPFRAARGRS